MALIDSSIFGIPFEGYDSYQNGTGGMKGVIAKAITLFDQTGTDMDKACLATNTIGIKPLILRAAPASPSLQRNPFP